MLDWQFGKSRYIEPRGVVSQQILRVDLYLCEASAK